VGLKAPASTGFAGSNARASVETSQSIFKERHGARRERRSAYAPDSGAKQSPDSR